MDGRAARRRAHGLHMDPRALDAWPDLPWRTVDRAVFTRQQRIYRANRRGDVQTVRTLQRRLRPSWDATLVATRRVTPDNRGQKTAGVDGVQSLTPPQRLRRAPQWPRHLTATPVRRVWSPTPGTAAQRP